MRLSGAGFCGAAGLTSSATSQPPPPRENNSWDHGASGPGGPSGSGPPEEPPRTFGKSYEAERVVHLLTQFGMRRPMRVPFVPLDAAAEGEGRPYVHGALEVRLCLSEDGDRLMVRVGSGPSGTGGRLMEIDDFVTRAEAIEARRAQRPKPIAEETEQLSGAASPLLSDARSGIDSHVSSLRSEALGLPPPRSEALDTASSAEKDLPSPLAVPWKSLFKAHWGQK